MPVERSKLIRGPLSLAALGLAIGGLVVFAIRSGCRQASPPARCPSGTEATGTRCCAPGQSEHDGRCLGTPRTCPSGFERYDEGCIVRPARVRITAATVRIGPGDWEAQGLVAPRDVTVDRDFELDAYEVTAARWADCVRAGTCTALDDEAERGCPVRHVSFEQARAFCQWAGGDLPTEDAWIVAASGFGANRYPWGNTGAVCRRADWGRWEGPCARGARGPEWAGLIEADRTPAGVVGMAGGVAEWVRSGGGGVARGGSWKSRLAAELRTWRRDERDVHRGYEDVGFRCMYP